MQVNLDDVSLHILDIANNAIQANSHFIQIMIKDDHDKIDILVKDDGDGMSQEKIKMILSQNYQPHTHTRGLGIPWLKDSIDQTNGLLTIHSMINKGTCLHGIYNKNKNCPSLGDLYQTIETLIYTNKDIDFYFQYNECSLNTKDIKSILQDVPLNHPTIRSWIKSYMKEGIKI